MANALTSAGGGAAAVCANIDAYIAALITSAANAADEIASVLADAAKTNHAWQNQTGDTEASIEGTVQAAAADIIDIYITAGMDYDYFLELAHGGKWAWLWPAVDGNRAQIFTILQTHLRAATI